MVRVDMSDEAFEKLKGVLAVAKKLTESERLKIAQMIEGCCHTLRQKKDKIEAVGGWLSLSIEPFALNMLMGSTLLVMFLLAEAEGEEMADERDA